MTELLAKYFSGNISEAERKEVHQWRNDSDENAEMFLDYASVWHNKEMTRNSTFFNDKEILESIFQKSEVSKTIVASKFTFKNIIRFIADKRIVDGKTLAVEAHHSGN